MALPIIGTLVRVTPVRGNAPYDLPIDLSVFVTLIPPGIDILIELPPFTIVLSAAQAAELAAALLELAA